LPPHEAWRRTERVARVRVTRSSPHKVVLTAMQHIATKATEVKPTRPRVLDKLPSSCNRVFDTLLTLSDDEGLAKVSLRDLASYSDLGVTQTWRAVHRLQRVHLLEVIELGKGTRATTWRVRWRDFSCSSVPPLRNLPKREKTKSNLSVASDDDQSQVSSLKGGDPLENPPLRDPLSHPVSEKGRRWFLGELRRFLRDDCHLPPDRYTELLLAFARALKLSLKANRIRTGRDLGHVYRFVRERLDTDPRYLASKLAKLEGGARYGAVMRLFADALRDLEHERKREQLNTEQLKRIREGKERAQREWQVSEPDFSKPNSIKLASPEFVDGFITNISELNPYKLPEKQAREILKKARLLKGFAPLNREQKRAITRICETFYNRVFRS